MKKTILTAASIMAITLSGAAIAEDNVPNTGDFSTDAKAEMKADFADAKAKVNAKLDNNSSTEAGVNASANADTNAASETYQDLKADTKAAYQDVKAETKETYQDVKARLFGEGAEGSAPASLDVSTRTSAAGMIGKPVFNSSNDKIATVSDIIVDKDGRAQLIVVSDGGFAGIGDKLAAFDYGLVVSQNADGDVFMPLSEDLLSKVAAFSYDPNDAGENVRMIPADGYSVAQLLKANLENQSGKKIANVENITFEGGEAKNIIVAFDQMLGIGGDRAAFDFDDVQVQRLTQDDVSIRLNARQSAEFEAFKSQNQTN